MEIKNAKTIKNFLVTLLQWNLKFKSIFKKAKKLKIEKIEKCIFTVLLK